jgi:hypothetical protein
MMRLVFRQKAGVGDTLAEGSLEAAGDCVPPAARLEK